MLSDEMPPMPGQTGHPHKAPNHAGVTVGGLFLYVKDADATFDRAVKAGCKVRAPLMDMFWGDRYGQLTDPFGHTWAVGTHIEDVPLQEIGKRQVEFMKKMAQGGKP
jgi:PhnB protein